MSENCHWKKQVVLLRPNGTTKNYSARCQRSRPVLDELMNVSGSIISLPSTATECVAPRLSQGHWRILPSFKFKKTKVR